jgi:hypothetical protein
MGNGKDVASLPAKPSSDLVGITMELVNVISVDFIQMQMRQIGAISLYIHMQ